MAWRRFQLHRHGGPAGFPPGGIAADGVLLNEPLTLTWPDGAVLQLSAGWCRVTWRGEYQNTVLWSSIEQVAVMNGRGAGLRIVWLDPPLLPPERPVPDMSEAGWRAVVPVDDLIEHDAEGGTTCVCGPRSEPVTREDGSIGWIYIHNSLDGRELGERDT